ncbi:hypothetical protein XACJK48_9060013 [Xanthomonas citri pv. citri]|nr:hypothetical protein XACJK2_2180002 [Xanthomonas citri pv. citri]CEH59304.1 hypothetical protein XACJK48_9060013 [Xanthomonas citri pv. citri]
MQAAFQRIGQRRFRRVRAGHGREQSEGQGQPASEAALEPGRQAATETQHGQHIGGNGLQRVRHDKLLAPEARQSGGRGGATKPREKRVRKAASRDKEYAGTEDDKGD